MALSQSAQFLLLQPIVAAELAPAHRVRRQAADPFAPIDRQSYSRSACNPGQFDLQGIDLAFQFRQPGVTALGGCQCGGHLRFQGAAFVAQAADDRICCMYAGAALLVFAAQLIQNSHHFGQFAFGFDQAAGRFAAAVPRRPCSIGRCGQVPVPNRRFERSSPRSAFGGGRFPVPDLAIWPRSCSIVDSAGGDPLAIGGDMAFRSREWLSLISPKWASISRSRASMASAEAEAESRCSASD